MQLPSAGSLPAQNRHKAGGAAAKQAWLQTLVSVVPIQTRNTILLKAVIVQKVLTGASQPISYFIHSIIINYEPQLNRWLAVTDTVTLDFAAELDRYTQYE